MARPIKKEDIQLPEINKIVMSQNNIVDNRPLIALTMRFCNATYTEIGEALGLTRQQGEYITKSAAEKLGLEV